MGGTLIMAASVPWWLAAPCGAVNKYSCIFLVCAFGAPKLLGHPWLLADRTSSLSVLHD